MYSKRFAIPIVAIAALAFPGLASANTGSVKCDSTGVVFSYNANFNPSRVSTETVNGVSQQFTVPKWKAVTHTWPGVTGTIVVGAKWTAVASRPSRSSARSRSRRPRRLRRRRRRPRRRLRRRPRRRPLRRRRPRP